MHFVGIDDHEIVRLKMTFPVINIKIKLTAAHRKDLNRPVPVLLPVIIPASALKKKDFERVSRLRDNNLM